MEVLTVAYSRANLLDDTVDSEYKYQANCMADQIYEKVAKAMPGIRRVDATIVKTKLQETGEVTNIIRFLIDSRFDVGMRVDRCFAEGAAFYAEKIIQHIKQRLEKTGNWGMYRGSR